MTRSRIVAAELVALIPLAVGFAFSHTHHCLDGNFIALALFLAPAHIGRLLAFLELAPAPPRWLFAAEVVALLSLTPPAALHDGYYTVPSWGLLVALVAALRYGTPTGDESAPGPRWLRWLAALATGAAAARLVRDAVVGDDLSLLRLFVFVPVLLEALAPSRSRSPLALLARTVPAFVLVGTSLRFRGLYELKYYLALGASFHVAAVASVLLVTLRLDSAERARARRRLAFRIATGVLVLVLVSVVGEIAIRAWPNRYSDIVPMKTFSRDPGTTYVFEGASFGPRTRQPVAIRWSKDRWHDVDHAVEKPAGTARVVVLGDSFIEAIQVDLEDMYHRVLGRSLASHGTPVETIAIANAGWGQVDEVRALEESGLRFAPDLVIDEFLPSNDVRNNQPELERMAGDDIARSTPARPLFIDAVNSRLVFHAFVFEKLDLTLRRALGRKDSLDMEVYREAPRIRPDLWADAWLRTERHLADMKRLSEKQGATFVVVIFTHPLEIEACVPGASSGLEGFDLGLPARRMGEICARLQVPCLDLAPRFALLPVDERRKLHLEMDGHWSASGHREAARVTADFLTTETTVWSDLVKRVGRTPR